MKIEEFLSRLEKVERSGDGWIACCPAHGDDNPSMSVAAGDDGRILVHCHAGCSAEAVVQAMGLQLRDLMPENGDGGRSGGKMRRKPAPKPEVLPSFAEKKPRDYGTFVAAYEYQDASGAAIYRVERRVRKDGKKLFVQQHPDPDSKYGWAYGVLSAGIERVPFHLPRLLAAAKAGKSVLIVEGEKDVLTAEETLGCAVTCNSGGAGKWEESFARHFAGAKGVVIVADNDPEFKADPKTGEMKPHWKGQRHAVDVERKLRAGGFEGTIKKMVMPSVGETACKDFTDWVAARRAAGLEVGKSAFREALEAAGDWPKAWQFGEADLADRERAQESARNTALSSAEPAEDAPGADGKGCGRFGRPAPRAPRSKTRVYQVDFKIGAERTARIDIGIDHYRFRAFGKDANGNYNLISNNEPIKLSLSSMFAMAFGNVARVSAGEKLASRQMSELQSTIALLWLRSRGKFFWDENNKGFATSLFFDEESGVLMRIRSDEFAAFIATEAEINRESSVFKYLMALIDDAAMSEQVSRGVIPSKMWDRRGDSVYVSSGDADMYRIGNGIVEKVQNGTDGVVFMRGKTLAPWTLKDGPGIDPFDKALIFSGASWSDKQGRMNVRLWVLNLFACHQTKPLLLITGQMQSGKTRMAKAIKEILGVRLDGRLDLSVQQVEDGDKGLDAFWATVNEGRLEVFDNLDTKIKWVADTLQNVATDGQTKRRTLYTTFGVSILRANASIILTSNNPLFSTEGNGGMADRLISVHLTTNRSAAMDTELSEDIARNRDEFLTWIARTVAKALADTGEVDKSVNRRHPDYGRFSVRCGRAFGGEREVIEALEAAEADKSLLPLMNDMITKEILLVLSEQYPPWVMRFTAGEMSDAILKRMGDDVDEKSKQMYGSRRVGKAISKYLRQLSVICNMNPMRIVDGRTVYDIAGLTVAGGFAVGLVDLKPTFDKSTHIETGAGALSENRGANPLNPLHARAPAPTLSSLEEEGNRESKENEVETGGGDEWEFDL